MQHLLQTIELASQTDLDVFRIGEHHRAELLDSAHGVIPAAAAARAKTIGISSKGKPTIQFRMDRSSRLI
jgi:alkanesulfonate monooxygenase SsuD/methylene tetrahydromethanopterin reductase-like flavin-dependent oxidoreductase (luciferase family)